MKNTSIISNEIEEFYSKICDEDRYSKGLGPLELERNQVLIQRHIQSPRSVVVDVGGGTGVYSEWLAILGHRVYLVDPVQKHISKARRKASKGKHPFTCQVGESKDLDFPDNFADVVFLHGPLYHLQSRKDRIKAIKEAKRVCKQGGVIIGIAINYASYTLVGLLNGIIHQHGFYEMCRKHLTTGIHIPPKDNLQLFLPEAYFHKPTELIDEFQEARLSEIELLAVEGICWLDKDFFQNWEEPVKKKTMMSLLQMTEKDLSLISFSPHMMIAGKK